MRAGFLLNPASGILHAYPASEACNTDQIVARVFSPMMQALRADKRFRRYCARCFRL